MKSIKDLIRNLEGVSTTACLLFSYLYSICDNNGVINKKVSDLAIKLSTSENNIRNIMFYMKNREDADGIISVSENDKNNNVFTITFTIKKRDLKKPKAQLNLIIDKSQPNIKKFLIDWYKEKDFDYIAFNNHIKYIKTISNKLVLSMKNKKMDVNEESIEEGFKVLFNNLPDWWIENGAIQLPTISKNFDKITNTIRHEKSTSKNLKFHSAISQIKSTDYSDIGKEK